MTEEEFAALMADIASQGQLEPIVLYEAAVLDGIHRQRACDELGIKPRTREYEGTAPAAFVIAMNVRRRHLSVGQQAATAEALVLHYRSKYPKQGGADVAKVATDLGLEKAPQYGGATTDKSSPVLQMVAKSVGVDEKAVETFSTLRRQAPELAKEVAAGTKALYTADAERKAAAKPAPSGRTPQATKQEGEDTDCAAYLAAIRAVSTILNRLMQRKPRRKKDYLAGAQDKLERVAATGRRFVESL